MWGLGDSGAGYRLVSDQYAQSTQSELGDGKMCVGSVRAEWEWFTADRRV